MSKEETVIEIIEHFGFTRNSNFYKYYIGITNDVN